MGVWDSISSLAAEGVDSVETLMGMGDKPQQIAATANTVAQDVGGYDMPAANGGVMTVGSNAASGLVGSPEDENSWVGDALKGAMPAILGAAMRPKPMQHAAAGGAGGSGISASGNGALAPFNEVTKMADNNPLDDIHSWANLFG